MIEFNCPTCRKGFSVGDDQALTRVTCPDCKRDVLVPVSGQVSSLTYYHSLCRSPAVSPWHKAPATIALLSHIFAICGLFLPWGLGPDPLAGPRIRRLAPGDIFELHGHEVVKITAPNGETREVLENGVVKMTAPNGTFVFHGKSLGGPYFVLVIGLLGVTAAAATLRAVHLRKSHKVECAILGAISLLGLSLVVLPFVRSFSDTFFAGMRYYFVAGTIVTFFGFLFASIAAARLIWTRTKPRSSANALLTILIIIVIVIIALGIILR